MTWTALTYGFGSKLTSAKMTQNQDNFTALAEGHSGAPKILIAAMDRRLAVVAETTGSFATLDIAMTSAAFLRYPHKFIRLRIRPVANSTGPGGGLSMRFSTNGGSSFDAGANDYEHDGISGDDELRVGGTEVESGSDFGQIINIYLFDTTDATAHTSALWDGVQDFANTGFSGFMGASGGKRNAAQDTDAVRFFYRNQNIGMYAYEIWGWG